MTELVNGPMLEFGFVQGRFVRAVVDTLEDEDRFPDMQAVEGQVIFRPKNVIRLVAGEYPATVVKDPAPIPLNDQGWVADAESMEDPSLKPGVWLPVGIYTVSPSFPRSSAVREFEIQVTAEHTRDNPLDLTLSAPVTVPPGFVEVTSPADRIRAEEAAILAEQYRDQAEEIIDSQQFIDWVDRAETSAAESAQSVVTTQLHVDESQAQASAAAESASQALGHSENAEGYARDSADSERAAQSYAEDSYESADASRAARVAAVASASAAEGSASSASDSASAAQVSAEDSEASASESASSSADAAYSADDARSSAGRSEQSAAESATSATEALQSADSARSDASSAADSAAEAEASASSAGVIRDEMYGTLNDALTDLPLVTETDRGLMSPEDKVILNRAPTMGDVNDAVNLVGQALDRFTSGSENLILDGGFEDPDMAYWVQGADTDFWSPTGGRTTDSSYRIPGDVTANQYPRPEWTHAYPGQVFYVEGHVRREDYEGRTPSGLIGLYIGLRANDGSGDISGSYLGRVSGSELTEGQWHRVSGNIKIPDGYDGVRFSPHVNANPDATYYWDDMRAIDVTHIMESRTLATPEEHGLMSAEDKRLLDTNTSSPDGSSIARRHGTGELSAADPRYDHHLATKKYVDSEVEGLASESYVDGSVSGMASESFVRGLVDGAMIHGRGLSSGEDLNDIVESGHYSASNAVSPSLVNRPPGAASSGAVIEVYSPPSGNRYIVQNWTRGPGLASQRFWRSRDASSGGWGEWVDATPPGLATSSSVGLMSSADKAKLDGAEHRAIGPSLVMRTSNGQFSAADPTSNGHVANKGYVDTVAGEVLQASSLSASQNLNSIESPGLYHQNRNVDASTSLNYPTELAGLLVVGAHSTFAYQTYFSYQSGSVYHRGKYRDNWSSWVELASTATTSNTSPGLMHHSYKAMLDGATNVGDGDTLALRNSGGQLSVAEASHNNHATNRGLVQEMIAAALAPKPIGSANLNDMQEPGQYYSSGSYASDSRNYPPGASGNEGALEVLRHISTSVTQRYTVASGSHRSWVRRRYIGGNWSSWSRVDGN